MGQSDKPMLLRLAGTLLAAASLGGCDDGTVKYRFTADDEGKQMPTPKLSEREKCFGIALAQYNDCAAGKGTSCAGTADKNYLPDRWKWVEPGTCEAQQGSIEQPEDIIPPSGK
jgi:uncharacterized membrane protein